MRSRMFKLWQDSGSRLGIPLSDVGSTVVTVGRERGRGD